MILGRYEKRDNDLQGRDASDAGQQKTLLELQENCKSLPFILQHKHKTEGWPLRCTAMHCIALRCTG
jgi:hypothetical protein